MGRYTLHSHRASEEMAGVSQVDYRLAAGEIWGDHLPSGGCRLEIQDVCGLHEEQLG